MNENEVTTMTCSLCGEEFPEEEGIYFDDQELCPECYNDRTVSCSACGDRVWNDDNAGDDNTPLCQRCYDNYYTTCDSCGRVIHYDDGYREDDSDDMLCYNCYCERQREPRAIHDYGFRPDPIFYPEYDQSLMYMGVELEIDNGGEDSQSAQEILDLANQDDENIYIKRDGSLNDGFEIVTHPMTLAYHTDNMPWKQLCRKAIELGYTSHKAETCGLHIHVSRTAFGRTREEQESVIARILFFIEAHFSEMLKFSRRTEYQLNRWAARYGLKENPKEILDHAKSSSLGRYTAVNLLNYNTIEFRFFRGTLKYSTLIAALQMVDTLCNAAVSMSDEDFKSMSWNDFVIRIKAPELVEYLKVRRLYVNEEIIGSEEV